jgi:tRNA threonylcarbamoyladenosine biosynthesis protein TsaE
MSTGMIWQTSSTNSADTERLGELLGSQLKGGEIIELRSDLGGGKTTFVRGLVEGAGSNDRVSSPTFTFSRIYYAKDFEIHHFDFYRLDDAGILRNQLTEALEERNVVIAEWANVVKDVLPTARITIEFKPTANSPDERVVTFKYTENYQPIVSFAESNYGSERP